MNKEEKERERERLKAERWMRQRKEARVGGRGEERRRWSWEQMRNVTEKQGRKEGRRERPLVK